MHNIQLTKSSSESDLKRYFTAVLELSKADNKFPINLGKTVSVVVDEEKGRIRTYIKWNTRGRAYIHALNSTNWDKRRAWHLLKEGKEVVAL